MDPCEVQCRDGSDKADYYLESLIIFESSAVADGAIYRSDSEQSNSQISECIYVGAGRMGEAEIELIAISDALIQQQSLDHHLSQVLIGEGDDSIRRKILAVICWWQASLCERAGEGAAKPCQRKQAQQV